MKPKNRTKKETRNPKQDQKKRLNNAINVEIQTDDGALGLSNELYRYNRSNRNTDQNQANDEATDGTGISRQAILTKQVLKLNKEKDRLKEIITRLIQIMANCRTLRTENDQTFVKDDLKAFGVQLKQMRNNVEGKMKQYQDECQIKLRKMHNTARAYKIKLKSSEAEKKEMVELQELAVKALESQLKNLNLARKEEFYAVKETKEIRAKLEDKLYLANNEKCRNCQTKDTVKEDLANQMAEKIEENGRLKFHLDEMQQRLYEQDRINKILTEKLDKINKAQKKMEFSNSTYKETLQQYQDQIKSLNLQLDNARKTNAKPMPNGPPGQRESIPTTSHSNSPINNILTPPGELDGGAFEGMDCRRQQMQKEPSTELAIVLQAKSMEMPQQQTWKNECPFIKDMQTTKQNVNAQNEQMKKVKEANVNPTSRKKSNLTNHNNNKHQGVAGVKQTNQMEKQSMPTGMVKEITANGNGTSSSSPAIFFQPPPKKSRTINANVWNIHFPGALSTAARHQAQQTSQITKQNQTSATLPNIGPTSSNAQVWPMEMNQAQSSRACPPTLPKTTSGNNIYRKCQGGTIDDFCSDINFEQQGINFAGPSDIRTNSTCSNSSWRRNSEEFNRRPIVSTSPIDKAQMQPINPRNQFDAIMFGQGQRHLMATAERTTPRALPSMYEQQQYPIPGPRIQIPRPPERPTSGMPMPRYGQICNNNGGNVLPWHDNTQQQNVIRRY